MHCGISAANGAPYAFWHGAQTPVDGEQRGCAEMGLIAALVLCAVAPKYFFAQSGILERAL
jgi:hypothetical protein